MVHVKSVSVFLTILYATQSGASKPLPNFVTPCKINDPDLSECVKNNVEKLRSRLVEGIPELQILGFDPLHVTKLTLSRNDSAALSYVVTLSDFVVEGGSQFAIQDLKIDLENPSLKLKLRIPETVLKTDFLATGVVVGFPLKDPGFMITEFSNVLINYESNGKRVTRKGKTYIEWDDGKCNTTYNKSKFRTERVFSDPDQLRLFNLALNENAEVLFSHVNPVLENTYGVYITESLRRVHKLFPLDVLYSEN